MARPYRNLSLGLLCVWGVSGCTIDLSKYDGSNAQVTIGGQVSGLQGSGLVLELNSSSKNSTTTLGPNTTNFIFEEKVKRGASYVVTVKAQPTGPNQVCSVVDGTGQAGTRNVDSVQVTCDPPDTDTVPVDGGADGDYKPTVYAVGGDVNGLKGDGLALVLNSSETITVPKGTSQFSFRKILPARSPYSITIGTQPSGQRCSLGKGTLGIMGDRDITDAEVKCEDVKANSEKRAVTYQVTSLSAEGLQLGNGSDVVAPSPFVKLDSTISVAQVVAGKDGTCVLTGSPGQLWCWGSNRDGRLGQGDRAYRGQPVRVRLGDEPVLRVSHSGPAICAVMGSGAVRCWGNNVYAQMGTPDVLTGQVLPTAPSTGDIFRNSGTTAVDVRVGETFACALLATGAVRCWGMEDAGQLARTPNPAAPSVYPQEIDLKKKATRIAVGYKTACAILEGGGIKCWGDNGSGQLGTGNRTAIVGTTDEYDGTPGGPLGSQAVDISLGKDHACALLANGRVRCWGQGSATGRNTIIEYVALYSNNINLPTDRRAIGIATTDRVTCALLEDGKVRCWGTDVRVMPNSSANPIEIPLSGPATAISGGANHVCVVINGKVQCWGDERDGRCGRPSFGILGDDEAPGAAGDVPIDGPIRDVAAADSHVCAVSEAGILRCWGRNETGFLGYGDQVPRLKPEGRVLDNAQQVAVGSFHSCALVPPGQVRCWGNVMQVGVTATGQYLPAPEARVVLPDTTVQIVAGSYHTCALSESGIVRCWGQGTLGELGLKSAGDLQVPRDPVPVGDLVRQIAAGDNFTCALTAKGEVRCWGSNEAEQLGLQGNVDPGTIMTIPFGASESAVKIGLGRRHGCALLNSGRVSCWGTYDSRVTNSSRDSNAKASASINVGGVPRDLWAGGGIACVRLAPPGGLRCWGANDSGQLGYGSDPTRLGELPYIQSQPPPADIPLDGENVAKMAISSQATCAIFTSGALRCWGLNDDGQLGLGFKGIYVESLPPSVIRGRFLRPVAPNSTLDLKVIQGPSDGKTCTLESGEATPTVTTMEPAIIKWVCR